MRSYPLPSIQCDNFFPSHFFLCFLSFSSFSRRKHCYLAQLNAAAHYDGHNLIYIGHLLRIMEIKVNWNSLPTYLSIHIHTQWHINERRRIKSKEIKGLLDERGQECERLSVCVCEKGEDKSRIEINSIVVIIRGKGIINWMWHTISGDSSSGTSNNM